MPPTPFDPCRRWLGIDAVELVDPRRVLGIAAGEADPLAVLQAAEARLALLRSVEPGPFTAARQALVARVEEARETVLRQIAGGMDSATKPAVRLSMPPPPGGAAPRPAAAVPRVPVVPPPPPPIVPPPATAAWPAAEVEAPNPAPVIRIHRPIEYRKRSSGGGLLVVLLVGLTAAAGALAWYKFRPQGRGSKRVAAVTAVDPAPAPITAPEPEPQPTPTREPKPQPTPAPAPQPQPTPQTVPEPAPPEPTPAEDTRQLESLLGTTAAALAQGDFAAARTAVKQAAVVAMSPPARDRVERWAELVTFAEGFAGYREQALAAVTAGGEYDIDGKKIGVVEIDDQRFIYRYAGRNKTVRRDRIPGGILMAIVTEWFDDNPANDLYIGAYHATKAEPDLEKARASWEKARAGGADASLLLPLLADPILTAPE